MRKKWWCERNAATIPFLSASIINFSCGRNAVARVSAAASDVVKRRNKLVTRPNVLDISRQSPRVLRIFDGQLNETRRDHFFSRNRNQIVAVPVRLRNDAHTLDRKPRKKVSSCAIGKHKYVAVS